MATPKTLSPGSLDRALSAISATRMPAVGFPVNMMGPEGVFSSAYANQDNTSATSRYFTMAPGPMHQEGPKPPGMM
jgi:hypothetical protein